MLTSNVEEIARTGSEESLINMLIEYGDKAAYKNNGTGDFSGYFIDSIFKGASEDKDEARKSRKIDHIAAYSALGKKAFKKQTSKAASQKPSRRRELRTLRQIAFQGAADKVVELLKAQANDQAAVSAIIKGVQKDRSRLFRRGTGEDALRRSTKKTVLREFFTKTGPFAPETPDQPPLIAEKAKQLAAAPSPQ